MVDITTPGDVVTATSANSPVAEQASNAIDNNIDTKYLNLDILNTGFTVASAGIVEALALTSANGSPERDPASFVLSGSNDGANYVELASGDIPVFGSRSERQIVPVNSSGSYSTYRIIFPTVASTTANSMQIAEVELLGTPPGPLA